ncbi:MAG: hypothetical protein HYS22_07090 [Deltaproteobacteria bacterium]|nr:hypothetical protein [Deltaproteobacteria bacterium]
MSDIYFGAPQSIADETVDLALLNRLDGSYSLPNEPYTPIGNPNFSDHRTVDGESFYGLVHEGNGFWHLEFGNQIASPSFYATEIDRFGWFDADRDGDFDFVYEGAGAVAEVLLNQGPAVFYYDSSSVQPSERKMAIADLLANGNAADPDGVITADEWTRFNEIRPSRPGPISEIIELYGMDRLTELVQAYINLNASQVRGLIKVQAGFMRVRADQMIPQVVAIEGTVYDPLIWNCYKEDYRYTVTYRLLGRQQTMTINLSDFRCTPFDHIAQLIVSRLYAP